MQKLCTISITKSYRQIELWISIHVNDWTAERAIIASNAKW